MEKLHLFIKKKPLKIDIFRDDLDIRKYFVLFFFNSLGFIFVKSFFDIYVLSLLFIISLIDIRYKIIPNSFVFLLASLIVFKDIRFEIKFEDLMSIFSVIFLFLISIFTDSLGMGDVKLLFVIFILKGSNFYNNLLINLSIILFFVSIKLIIEEKTMNRVIPMAPFIYFSYYLCFI